LILDRFRLEAVSRHDILAIIIDIPEILLILCPTEVDMLLWWKFWTHLVLWYVLNFYSKNSH